MSETAAASRNEAELEAERQAQEEALIEQLKEKHKVSQVHTFISESGHAVHVRMPDQARWRRFRAQVNDDRKRVDAAETLFRSCLLWPAPAALEAMLDEQPGLLDTFASQLVKLAGLDREVEKKVR